MVLSTLEFWPSPAQVSRLALSGLRNWTTAAVPSAVFAARHFRPFLPLRGQVALGEPWWIIPSELSVFTGYLSNNRFYPPPPKGKEVRAAPGEPWGPSTAPRCLLCTRTPRARHPPALLPASAHPLSGPGPAGPEQLSQGAGTQQASSGLH